MKGIMQKLLCAAALCTVCTPVAFSQESDGMSREDLENVAKITFSDDIRAGKLTVQQAADYSQCANDDYAKNFFGSPVGVKYMDTTERLFSGEKKGAAEEKKLKAELDAMQPELRKYQDAAEDRCTKKLGVKVTRGKVFGQGF